jgi:hypothetical protein
MDHFYNTNSQCNNSIRIQPIEKITQDEQTTPEQIQARLLEREDHHIRTLRTLAPWGLNLTLNNQTPLKNIIATEQAFLPVNSLSKKPGARGLGIYKKPNIINFKPITFMDRLMQLDQKPLWQHQCRINFNRLNKKQLKILGTWLQGEGETILREHPKLLAVCTDLITHRLTLVNDHTIVAQKAD